jgi:insulysin
MRSKATIASSLIHKTTLLLLKKVNPTLHLRFINCYLLGFILSAFLTLSVSSAFSDDYQVVQDENILNILTPSLKKRETLKIRLNNGLEAYLISDPGLDKSGAGLAVNVGSWKNPQEFPGLAHFLEHMLFLGTEKYPEESGYQRFLEEHGGMHNAFTAGDRTVYMFSVNNDAFPIALDRFAQFFISPLFNPSGISREVNAIDQEYAKNVQNDAWRVLFVTKAVDNPKHPNTQFDIGNLETISKIPQSALKNWFSQNYSANLMHLIIYSPLPLDEIKKLVIQDFSLIENKHIEPFLPKEPLKLSSNYGSVLYVEPYQDIRHLIMQWEMPISLKYDAEAVEVVLSYEDNQSLVKLLKDEGLIEGLSVSTQNYAPSLIFIIDVNLTEEGVKNVNTVIEHIFEAIALLKETNVSKEIFDESQTVAKNLYEYQSRSDVFTSVMDNSDKMIDEPLETYPLKSAIGDSYNPSGIKQVIDSLKASTCQFIVLARSSLTGIKPQKKEKWLGADYSIQKIPASNLIKWDTIKPNDKLALPASNPFVAEHLTLLNNTPEESKTLLPHPEVIVDNASAIIYYAQDTRFLVPEMALSFRVHTPLRKPGNSLQEVTLDLYLNCLSQQLSQLLYQAQVAHLNCNIEPIESGVQISINGYSEKAKILFEKVLDKIAHFKIDDQTFKIEKDALLKSYSNAALDSPLSQGMEIVRTILNKNFVCSDKKAQAIKNVTKESMMRFAQHLFNKTYVEGFLYGNITKDEALSFSQLLHDYLNSKPWPKSEIPQKMVLKLNGEAGPFLYSKKIDQSGNANILVIENGCFSIKKRSMLQVLSKGIQEPFFSELRTRQQTGYIVATDDKDVERELMQFFVVQSNTHDPCDLNSRFELFIENMLRDFETKEFTKERFDTIRASITQELKMPFNNLYDMAKALEILAFDYDGDFNWLDKRIQSLQDISYDEFTAFAMEFLGKENKRRLNVQINGIIPKKNDLHYTNTPTIQRLRALGEFLSKNENICNNEE